MDESTSLLVGLALGGLFAVTMLALRQLQVVRGRSYPLRVAAVTSLVGFGFALSGYIVYAREAHGVSAGLMAAACFGPLFIASVMTRITRLRRKKS